MEEQTPSGQLSSSPPVSSAEPTLNATARYEHGWALGDRALVVGGPYRGIFGKVANVKHSWCARSCLTECLMVAVEPMGTIPGASSAAAALVDAGSTKALYFRLADVEHAD